MRALLAALLLTACTSRDPDLNADEQGLCSNLDYQSCIHTDGCQMAFIHGGVEPVLQFHCLALEDGQMTEDACPTDRDGCRATRGCSPLFFQKTGGTDEPIGDPVYETCDLTGTLATRTF